VDVSLQSPWTSADIGNPSIPGGATFDGGTFQVNAAGGDIWNTSDQFHFVFQPLTGDGELVARVGAIQQTNGSAKAGVMFRESLTAESAHAFMAVTAARGFAFQRRRAAGRATESTAGCNCSAPGWVRLVRQGNRFTAYESVEGNEWRQVASETILMAPTIYAGLALAGHNTDRATSATFTNVALTTQTAGSPINSKPTVSILEPVPGAGFVAPATIALAAAASDQDGTIARVDFYANHQFIGSAAADPFWTTWHDVPQGTYELTAIATDDAGATSYSAPVPMTVAAATGGIPPDPSPTPYRPSTLVFGPSAHHDTDVDGYRFELRRAGDAPSASPVATRDLRKPSVVSGEISVDVSGTVDALPSGAYYAIVVTISTSGATPSAPSAEFWK
jgi:hypothetical protein